MNNDIKTSLTGAIVGITGILSHFGVMIPESWQGPIIFIGVLVLGYFTNKKDTPKQGN